MTEEIRPDAPLVYVAGPYSGQLLDSLQYIRAGVMTGYELIQAGFCPYIPWLDFLLSLIGGPLSINQYHSYSLRWLRACHVVYCLDGWQRSKGAQQEVEIAGVLGIPVVESTEELLDWYADYRKDKLL